MLELLTQPEAWAALVTLTALEIVLGIDNIVFISVLVSRCSPSDAKRARQIGLSLALIFRVVLLFGLTWLMKLTYPVFGLLGQTKIGALLGGSEAPAVFASVVALAEGTAIYKLRVTRDYERLGTVVERIMGWHGGVGTRASTLESSRSLPGIGKSGVFRR